MNAAHLCLESAVCRSCGRGLAEVIRIRDADRNRLAADRNRLVAENERLREALEKCVEAMDSADYFRSLALHATTADLCKAAIDHAREAPGEVES